MASNLLIRNITEATDVEAKQSEMAKLARIEMAKGNKEKAKSIFSDLVSLKPLEISNLTKSEYLESTKNRIADLQRLVSGRDVFLLAHGPSIGELKQWCKAQILALDATGLLQRCFAVH